MGKLFGVSNEIPFADLVDCITTDTCGPDIVNSFAFGSRAIFPRITGSNPGTRECLEGYAIGHAKTKLKVTGLLIQCGDQTGRTSLKARFAIVNRDGSFYTGTPGVDTVLPLNVIGGLTMAAGVASGTALTAGGGANGRWLRYNFDNAGVIPAGTPFYVRCLAECEYSVTDSATLWNSNFLGFGGATMYPHAESGAGLTGASYRPLLGVALRTGGIDTITDATMANPGTAGVQALIGGASTTISAKTVDIGIVHAFVYKLICERIS